MDIIIHHGNLNRDDPSQGPSLTVLPSPFLSLAPQDGGFVLREVHRQEVQGWGPQRGGEQLRGQVHQQVLAVRGHRGPDAGSR